MYILVTGASGFIGRHLVRELLHRSMNVRVVRREASFPTLSINGAQAVALSGSGGTAADWGNAVARCRAVVHLAARAHALNDYREDSARALYSANVEYARACGEAAVKSGVDRFIFLSSVGVHGSLSLGQPFGAESPLVPNTPYARSKVDAEHALVDVMRGTGTALTVIRPPLVYGLDSPGKFGALMRAVACGWPLPLARVTDNRRSIVAIDNLVDLILTCLDHPAAANQNFLVSDGEDISTADLMRRLGKAMGRPARLLPVQLSWLAIGAKLLGKPDLFESLCGSLQVDMGKTRELLGWSPRISVDEGLKRAVEGIRC